MLLPAPTEPLLSAPTESVCGYYRWDTPTAAPACAWGLLVPVAPAAYAPPVACVPFSTPTCPWGPPPSAACLWCGTSEPSSATHACAWGPPPPTTCTLHPACPWDGPPRLLLLPAGPPKPPLLPSASCAWVHCLDPSCCCPLCLLHLHVFLSCCPLCLVHVRGVHHVPQ